MDAPLILTLTLDDNAAQLFNRLRRQHFPPERNYLSAHLTLFHHLPGPQHAAIAEHLVALSHQQAPMPLRVTGLQMLGRGVAYRLENEALGALHRNLQQTWQAQLTPQDQQRLRPHVTIQNKVDPAVARQLHEQLSQDFVPFEATGTGLALWVYRNGPWEALQEFRFEG